MVAIPGLGYMPMTDADEREEAKLLYVAMTRATYRLLLTSHRESGFVTRLKNARAKTVTSRSEANLRDKSAMPGSDASLEGLLRYSPLDDE